MEVGFHTVDTFLLFSVFVMNMCELWLTDHKRLTLFFVCFCVFILLCVDVVLYVCAFRSYI